MTIEKLQKLKLDAVKPETLQKAVKDLLEDYNEATDKETFNKIAKDNIEKVFSLVEKLAPDAIVKEKKNPEPKPKGKEEKKLSKDTKKELDALSEGIKQCRIKIRKYNEEKRKGKPQKPKPKRHEKIKKHFISIGNLIPPNLKENLEVQKEAEKILLRGYREIINAFRINTIHVKEGVEAIKDKYDEIEEKIKK
ncbi:hypothetical protein [Flavivirga rizhaonensis]|uniref:Uncharacterized protein n=1 Tax=Flavivirga rizhaonensis TaxID=2559571 RepID=A0A4S1DZZ5_9FLAO|nr:hypothetical protein [Flavivirga rizhaonensis]TGV03593.1 hypothetical protein EM932_06090 [Flavivirga rizhaonensis]